MAEGKSKLGCLLKVLVAVVVIPLLLVGIAIGVGISKRGLHQDAYYTYPFAKIPVELPRDHYAHDDFKTEWWYYTGHLYDEVGRRYGFEFTFFRLRTVNLWYNGVPVWWIMYPHGMAGHVAITDFASDQFSVLEKMQQNSSDNAGASSTEYKAWLKNWMVSEKDGRHHIDAPGEKYGLDLWLKPLKPAALHGENGYHWKGVYGIPSYYISFTRMDVEGKITVAGKPINVVGEAWMDHEYTSFKPSPKTRGWDWFSIQLDNNIEVMLYQMHRTDGAKSDDSTGTVVLQDGSTVAVTMPAYSIESTGTWTSPRTGGIYPHGWIVKLPGYDAELTVTPLRQDQEMVMELSQIEYWEGACDISGTWQGEPIKGKGYIELSGYTAPIANRF